MVNSMLITRTEVNLNYKLDYIKWCFKCKQYANELFTLYLKHKAICRMKICLPHTLVSLNTYKLVSFSNPVSRKLALRNLIASENVYMPCSLDKFKHTHSVVGFLKKKK